MSAGKTRKDYRGTYHSLLFGTAPTYGPPAPTYEPPAPTLQSKPLPRSWTYWQNKLSSGTFNPKPLSREWTRLYWKAKQAKREMPPSLDPYDERMYDSYPMEPREYEYYVKKGYIPKFIEDGINRRGYITPAACAVIRQNARIQDDIERSKRKRK
jgi:hypothetical protein